MEFEALRMICTLSYIFNILTYGESRISRRQAAAQSQYYLAYCPIRQGNYITYSSSLCYCRKGQQEYDCRPAGNAIATAVSEQMPPPRPTQAVTPVPLRPPPVAPPPPPPPNRPSSPPNVDSRPGIQLFLVRVMVNPWTTY